MQILHQFNKFIEYKRAKISPRTYPNYLSVRKNLSEFLNSTQGQQFKFIEDIRIPFMMHFNDHLLSQFESSHVKRNINTICAFCSWLVNMERLEFNKVREYSPIAPRSFKKIVQLTSLELETLENHKPINNRLKKVKDVFLFQCYAGLAYGDLKAVNKDHIQTFEGMSYLISERGKTGIEFCTPLLSRAKTILKRYGYKLPVLSNQKYNQYLKELALAIGLNKRLSSHVGRRTCGQLFLNYGYSIEAVSKILGHADIKTTQNYYARASFERVHNDRLKLRA